MAIEPVEVNQFDIERLAHMRAPGARQTDHLRLVARLHEFGLDGLRLGRNKTEGEKRRQDLYEDDIHGRWPANGRS